MCAKEKILLKRINVLESIWSISSLDEGGRDEIWGSSYCNLFLLTHRLVIFKVAANAFDSWTPMPCLSKTSSYRKCLQLQHCDAIVKNYNSATDSYPSAGGVIVISSLETKLNTSPCCSNRDALVHAPQFCATILINRTYSERAPLLE